MTKKTDSMSGGIVAGNLLSIDPCLREDIQEVQNPGPRIALLTPYTGGNLGDAAIQDAMIVNLQLRLPGAQFSGISLNCESFVERHASSGAFPLCANGRSFYSMFRGRIGEHSASTPIQKGLPVSSITRALKQVPVLAWCLMKLRACWRELRHWVQGYRFLRTQDLVIVSGGGQLNEEWGGPWSQPFALLKWAILARIARIPYAVASVGAGKATSKTCRCFLAAALRLARYRSYRDKHSRAFAAGLMARATQDPVVPDLALSLPVSKIPKHAGRRTVTTDRPTIAISPISYAKPQRWPSVDRDLYDRYIGEMARIVLQLLERDYPLVIVWSSIGDDESAIADLLQLLDEESKSKLLIPQIATWQDLVASLQEVDYVIASRLHSTILSFVSRTPVVAISFDPKVDWVMEDLGQTDYLLQIRDFSAEDAIDALDRMMLSRKNVTEHISSYRQEISSVSSNQYHTLAKIAATSWRRD
jgi:polysaccharide pyruvyl transferase WcaK-like protein